MKPTPTILVLNSRRGYCYTPERYESRREAITRGRQAVESGLAFAYRVYKVKQ